MIIGLTEKDRKDIVKFRLEKANETFAEILILIENKFYRTAANRLYYACYYAVSALLVKDGHTARFHNGVFSVFGREFVVAGIISKEQNRLYRNLFNLRQGGDYGDWFEVKEEDVKDFIAPAEQFINTIENLINENK